MLANGSVVKIILFLVFFVCLLLLFLFLEDFKKSLSTTRNIKI